MDFKTQRNSLGLSQSCLARLARVSRFKICQFESGNGSLTPEEMARIREAITSEATRLRLIASSLEELPALRAPDRLPETEKPAGPYATSRLLFTLAHGGESDDTRIIPHVGRRSKGAGPPKGSQGEWQRVDRSLPRSRRPQSKSIGKGWR